MASSSALDDVNGDIAKLEKELEKLRVKKTGLFSVFSDALSQRPTGIPQQWLPEYDEKNGKAVVTAWFDPAKYGSNFQV